MDCSRIDDSNKFWSVIETKMGCIVPNYVRNILRLRGFDDAVSVSKITKDDIEALKHFAKNSMNDMIPSNANRLDYYFLAVYEKNPEAFEIAPGHVKLLESIIDFIKEKTVIHGHEYFNFYSIEPTQPVKVQGKGRAGKLNKTFRTKKNFLLVKSAYKSGSNLGSKSFENDLNEQQTQLGTNFILS